MPGSLVLVHGAGSGPWIFSDWPQYFPDLTVEAVDLHAGLDVGQSGMTAYAGNLIERAGRLPRPLWLCGWSMGGLVALMAAQSLRPAGLVLLEPSPPADIQGSHPNVPLTVGTYDPEQEYDAFPAGIPSRPESSLARAERKRGISVPRIPCPALVIFGCEFPEERGRRVASLYGSPWHDFPDLSHWELILDPRVPQFIAQHPPIGGSG